MEPEEDFTAHMEQLNAQWEESFQRLKASMDEYSKSFDANSKNMKLIFAKINSSFAPLEVIETTNKKSFPELHEFYHADPDVDIPGFGVHPRPFFSVAPPKVYYFVDAGIEQYSVASSHRGDVYSARLTHTHDKGLAEDTRDAMQRSQREGNRAAGALDSFPRCCLDIPSESSDFLTCLATIGIGGSVFDTGAMFKQFDRGKH